MTASLRSVLRPFAMLLAACGTADAAAERYACVLGPTSTVNQTTNLVLPLAGTWIGNYNATTNPTGTQTRPGLFGGSGNVAIPYSMSIRPTITINGTHPAGTFTLGFDPVTRAVAVFGLQSNLLNGQPGTVAVNIRLTYQTFRSFSPNSTFIGVTNVDVPLESGSLTTATAAQSNSAYGVATANTDGSFAFTVPVPVTISVAGSAAGQPFASESPGILALSGTITVAGGQATVAAQATTNETAPVPPPPPLVDQPFGLPTILPPGSTANLLLSGTFSEGTVATNSTITIAAVGPRIPRPADFNGDGAVTGDDLGQLLAAWGAPGIADLNLDGIVDGNDLGQLLAQWG
ncbi:MAG: hypothetical protein ACKOJI_00940 [Phycisphaerales bacterium]